MTLQFLLARPLMKGRKKALIFTASVIRANEDAGKTENFSNKLSFENICESVQMFQFLPNPQKTTAERFPGHRYNPDGCSCIKREIGFQVSGFSGGGGVSTRFHHGLTLEKIGTCR